MTEFVDFSPNLDASDGLVPLSEPSIAHIGRMLIMNEGIHHDPAVAEYLRQYEEDVRQRTEALSSSSGGTAKELAKTPIEIWDLPGRLGADVFRDENHHGNR